jgi:hypothetical protein
VTKVTEIDELVQFLASDQTDGYGSSPIPSPIDDAVRRLLQFGSSADVVTPFSQSSEVEESLGFVLAAFAQRMAAIAVRNAEERYLSEGLLALRLALRVLESREILPVLSLLLRSAQKVGSNVEALFSAASVGDTAFRTFLTAFLRRSERDQSIEAMGYVESCDKDGFRYRGPGCQGTL